MKEKQRRKRKKQKRDKNKEPKESKNKDKKEERKKRRKKRDRERETEKEGGPKGERKINTENKQKMPCSGGKARFFSVLNNQKTKPKKQNNKNNKTK